MKKLALILGSLWALPLTILGLLLTVLGTNDAELDKNVGALYIEVGVDGHLDKLFRWFGIGGLTLGNIVFIIQPWFDDKAVRSHEGTHVRQYMALGPLFLIAYPLSSLLAIFRGQNYYLGNWFEKQASAAENSLEVRNLWEGL